MLTNCFATYDRARSLGSYNFGAPRTPLSTRSSRAVEEMDPGRREALLILAVEQATADVPIIPLIMLENIFATRRDVVLAPRRDERTIAFDVTPA